MICIIPGNNAEKDEKKRKRLVWNMIFKHHSVCAFISSEIIIFFNVLRADKKGNNTSFVSFKPNRSNCYTTVILIPLYNSNLRLINSIEEDNKGLQFIMLILHGDVSYDQTWHRCTKWKDIYCMHKVVHVRVSSVVPNFWPWVYVIR